MHMTTKMKFLFIFFTAISCLAYGQEYDQMLISKNNVCSIKEYMFRPNENKKLTGAFYFDKKGNLIEQYESSYTTPTIKYKYDSLGHLIEKTHYRSDKTVNEYYKWTYDSLSNIKTHVTYFSWTKKEYKDNYFYDSNNRLIEIYELNDKNVKVKSTTYLYHQNGKIKEERFQNSEIGLDRIKKFDICGNLSQKIENGVSEIFFNQYSDSCNIDHSKDIKSKSIDTLPDKSIRKTTIYGLMKTVEVETLSGLKKSYEEYKYFDSDKSVSSSHIIVYNEKGQIVETKDFYSGKGMWQCSHSNGTPSDSDYNLKYYYFPNGLKEKYEAFDTNGKQTEYVKYETQYYK